MSRMKLWRQPKVGVKEAPESQTVKTPLQCIQNHVWHVVPITISFLFKGVVFLT